MPYYHRSDTQAATAAPSTTMREQPCSPTTKEAIDMSDVNDLDSDSAVYKTLLESTKAIPWKIDWATMTFAYIGPQIEPLLGWSQASREKRRLRLGDAHASR